MSIGLYSRNNLSESGLNAKESLQKLYAPQIQEDILLFSFASRLESSAASLDAITGLKNESISDPLGNVYPRTKIVTNNLTFTDNNSVWFEKIPDQFDKRSTTGETGLGCPIKVSTEGSITSVTMVDGGNRYGVKSFSTGGDIALPATVNVGVRGKTSGASNGVINITVSTNGSISLSSTFNVITPGSKYLPDEELEIIPGCLDGEIPLNDKCIKYGQNYLYQVNFLSGVVSTKALLKNSRYTYRVRFSRVGGFFLYDDRTQKYLYLGSFYGTYQPLSTPDLVIRRKDTISSANITQLYNLNGYSAFNQYGYGYKSSSSISSSLTSISDSVVYLQKDLSNFIQNTKPQVSENDSTNIIGIRHNIIEGKNIFSNYRLIFRDPDGVLDQSSVDFYTLSALNLAGEVNLNGERIPGIWLWTGEKYKRIFSSDDRPFVSQIGRKYLSPAIYNASEVELAESGAYKYSLSTAYLKPGTSVIRGFDTQISTLVQNLSSSVGAGGFVYYRQLTPTTFSGTSVKAWPLFSYTQNGQTKDARFLAV
jgi:hypothetical protein